jgi:DNA polymerase-3 subunit alpha
VLGVYLSGHPLEKHLETLNRTITARTVDFMRSEEDEETKVRDGEKAIIGGMVTSKTIKYTKNNTVMAFLTLEDLFGTVEVIVFPRQYAIYQHMIEEDAKLFIKGRVNLEEEKNGKLICETMTTFGEPKKELWLQFDNRAHFEEKKQKLFGLIASHPGKDSVILYLKQEKQINRLPSDYEADTTQELIQKVYALIGGNNVKILEK